MYHSRGVPQWTCMTSTTPILLICMSISDHEQAMYVCMCSFLDGVPGFVANSALIKAGCFVKILFR